MTLYVGLSVGFLQGFAFFIGYRDGKVGLSSEIKNTVLIYDIAIINYSDLQVMVPNIGISTLLYEYIVDRIGHKNSTYFSLNRH